MLTSFGPFWEDFGAVWEPFGSPKLRKRGRTSIPKNNPVFDMNFNEFWMILYGFVNRKSSTNIGFYSVL